MIDPGFFEHYKTVMLEQGYEGEFPDYGSGFMALIMFLTGAIIGFIVFMISAMILQSKTT